MSIFSSLFQQQTFPKMLFSSFKYCSRSKVFVFGSACQTTSSCWPKGLPGSFRKCPHPSLPVLCPSCTQAGVLCEGLQWGVSWESTEPVIMDKHLAPFPPERLQRPQPNHCLWRHYSVLAHSTKSISLPPACLPRPPWSAHRNLPPSQTFTDEKQIQYLTTSQAANYSVNSSF